eukprot:365966-Chlamydomonas_euryale.AAC.3
MALSSKMGLMALLLVAAVASASAAHGGPYPYKYYVSNGVASWIIYQNTCNEAAPCPCIATYNNGSLSHLPCLVLAFNAQAYLKGKFEVPSLVTKTWGFGYVEWNDTDILVSAEVSSYDADVLELITIHWHQQLHHTFGLDLLNYPMACAAVQLHNAEGITAMHVHNGTMGVNGPVVIPVAGFMMPGTDRPQPVSGHFQTYVLLKTADYMWLPELLSSGMAYFNAHSVANPGGEVRGQFYVSMMPEDDMM